MLCMTDSAKNSEDVDSNEVEDLDFREGRDRSDLAAIEEREYFHSGLVMIPVTPSRTADLSFPETDCPFRPFSISRRPVHHLLKMLTRLSRSSARKFLFDGCSKYVLRKGRRTARIMLVFCMLVLDKNLWRLLAFVKANQE